MKKRYTIKDIAKEANVSVATVSYILNDRKDQKISEETVKRVKQIINLYNYRPNANAQNLSASRNPLVAISVPPNSILSTLTLNNFLEQLSLSLRNQNYSLLYLPNESPESYNQIAALVVLNATKEYFYEISNKNFCPVIAVDSFINDPLFFQVNMDYISLKEEADAHFSMKPYTFITLNFENVLLKERLESTFSQVIFLDDLRELEAITKDNLENIVLIQPVLYNLLSKSSFNIFYKNAECNNKFSQIIKGIENATNRLEDIDHKLLY